MLARIQRRTAAGKLLGIASCCSSCYCNTAVDIEMSRGTRERRAELQADLSHDLISPHIYFPSSMFSLPVFEMVWINSAIMADSSHKKTPSAECM